MMRPARHRPPRLGFSWRQACLGVLLLMGGSEGAYGLGATPATPPGGLLESPLAASIREFLTTDDSARADSLLENIVRDPAATVETVRAVLQAGRRYAPQPVGILFSQPVLSQGRHYSYGLFVPETYTPERAYALVVCLHGAGFTGDAYLERWRSRLGEQYILACPTLMQGDWWTRSAEHLVIATIRAVQRHYHIDSNRIFLTGMSNGGIGAWLIGCHYAPLFAGLSPMASGLDDVLFPFLENLRNTPAYIIHGRRDQVMPIELSRSIADALSRMGYRHTLREHDRSHPMAGGHFFPREELPDLIGWLEAQRRDSARHIITVVRDASHLRTFGWVRIDATERIAALSENLVDGDDPLIKQRVYAKLEAQITGPHRIEVRTERVHRFTLFLNEDLIDLSGPLTVLTNGHVAFAGPLHPNLATLLRQARARQDWQVVYPVEIHVAVREGA